MTAEEKTAIELIRAKALHKLLDISESWNGKMYTDADFMLDKALRYAMNLPRKEMGKPPYENIKL